MSADRDAIAAALRMLHERAEAFNPAGTAFRGTPARTYGRGRLLPGAYSLDHEIGTNAEGCDGCAAYVSLVPSPVQPAALRPAPAPDVLAPAPDALRAAVATWLATPTDAWNAEVRRQGLAALAAAAGGREARR